MTENRVQRLRMIFAKGEAIKYISHLDLARTWERAFRRADLPLVYSQGFNPHPRFALGAALSVGLTSNGEVLDLWLSPPLSPQACLERLSTQLPPGLSILRAWEVDLALPSLQSCMRWAEYRVTLCSGQVQAEIEQRIARFLAAESLPRQRLHKDKVRMYDLRPLVARLALASEPFAEIRFPANHGFAAENGFLTGVLEMRLATSSEATARVDEVLAELGLQDAVCAIERTQLIWEEIT